MCVQVAMDPSGLYVACSSSDKTVSLFDFYSGECLAKLYGHSGIYLLFFSFFSLSPTPPSLSVTLLPLSEVVTQVKFSTDCRFLYSVSGDGYVT